MASYFVIPAGGNSNTSATYSLTNGGAGGAGIPTASDDLFLTSLSGPFTVNAALACRSMDCNGYTLLFTASANISIGTSTNAASNIALRFNSAMSIVGATTNLFIFVSSSGVANTITSATITFPGGVFFNNASGSWTLSDNLAYGGVWTFSAGTFNANGKTITINNASSFNGGGKTYFNVLMQAGGVYSIAGANTFGTLTRLGGVTKLDAIQFLSSQTITTLLDLEGGSTTRLLVSTNTAGTAITLTSASNTMQNVDFRDITGAGAASWNLASITGGSGDCGGNSGITFTTATVQTWTGLTTGGNWSDASKWTSRMPLPQDTAFFGVAFVGQQTITVDTPRLCSLIDWTGVTFTVGAPIWAKTTQCTVYGNIIMAPVMFNQGSTNVICEWRTTHYIATGGAAFTNPLQFTFTTNYISNAAPGVIVKASTRSIQQTRTITRRSVIVQQIQTPVPIVRRTPMVFPVRVLIRLRQPLVTVPKYIPIVRRIVSQIAAKSIPRYRPFPVGGPQVIVPLVRTTRAVFIRYVPQSKIRPLPMPVTQYVPVVRKITQQLPSKAINRFRFAPIAGPQVIVPLVRMRREAIVRYIPQRQHRPVPLPVSVFIPVVRRVQVALSVKCLPRSRPLPISGPQVIIPLVRMRREATIRYIPQKQHRPVPLPVSVFLPVVRRAQMSLPVKCLTRSRPLPISGPQIIVPVVRTKQTVVNRAVPVRQSRPLPIPKPVYVPIMRRTPQRMPNCTVNRYRSMPIQGVQMVVPLLRTKTTVIQRTVSQRTNREIPVPAINYVPISRRSIVSQMARTISHYRAMPIQGIQVIVPVVRTKLIVQQKVIAQRTNREIPVPAISYVPILRRSLVPQSVRTISRCRFAPIPGPEVIIPLVRTRQIVRPVMPPIRSTKILPVGVVSFIPTMRRIVLSEVPKIISRNRLVLIQGVQTVVPIVRMNTRTSVRTVPQKQRESVPIETQVTLTTFVPIQRTKVIQRPSITVIRRTSLTMGLIVNQQIVITSPRVVR